ncbi:ATPase, T2SS/T4P/T4SS family [Methanolobus mangrovi]|uniref:ATPase, T2SS/T4P/T4SS family n=1 Tax=Methanolobus mangrovi TaxID=3072977 RepID=A0AA51UHR9_9EURY|nr:ATPase, T2SS/T4P/T4SS family [Methanolobus mangrovi]WMW23109.1 ATPase, T2SS/T4P/T4SS family [Methanolobus mangrovi]
MADAQLNAPENNHSKSGSKNDNLKELSDEEVLQNENSSIEQNGERDEGMQDNGLLENEASDDEIDGLDILKEISKIKEDEDKFEKDFAHILDKKENDPDPEEDQDQDESNDDDSKVEEQGEEEEIGILLPRSPNFGPPKSIKHDLKKEILISLEDEEDEIPELLTKEEEEKIKSSTPSEDESKTDITLEEENPETTEEKQGEKEEKLGFIDKIRTLFKRTEIEIEPYDAEIHGPITEFKGVEGYQEIERYWVNEPYAFIVILYDEDKNNHLYYIVEPELTEFEHTFLLEIKDRLRDVLLVEDIDDADEDKEAVLESKIRSIIQDYTIEITPPMLEKISYYIKRDFVRFGKIDALMKDDSIEDVSGNGHDVPIFLYHRAHQNIATNVVYEEDELNSFIIQMAQRSGKHISVAEPMIDATMPDGSRIQMTLGTSVTAHGSTFTIRKFSDTPITPVDLVKWGTFSSESMAYLWLCIENNKSLIYAGGTASGKTSSLNAVSLFIPEKAKVITLEDTRELKLPHPNWIPSITRDSFTADERGAVDMYDLLKAALRQRPEFLLVGEVRGKEALTLFQAMSTGHTTFSTMHADSVASAIHRLENPPISVPRTMIQALDIMSIQSQTYTQGKRVRRNIKLVEIIDIDPNTRNIRTNDIFVWDSESDMFIRTGESKALFDIKMRRGWGQGRIDQELYYRQKILEHMVSNDVTDFQEISDIINAYQSTPEKVLRKLKLA